MKKFIKDPIIFCAVGQLGVTIAIFSENLYVKLILLPIFFLIEFFGIALMIKDYLNEKKAVKKGEKNTTDSSHIKPDISIWMALLAAFGSLLSVVVSLVLLLFLDKGNLVMFKYFLIATSCIHLVIVAISFTVFLKYLQIKRQNISFE